VIPSVVKPWLREQRRQRRGKKLYGQFVRRGSLCFDVGANMGDRSLMLRRLGGRVIAIEPQPLCAEALRSLGFAVEQVALGARVGEAEMRISSAHTISSLADGWIGRVQETSRFGGESWGEPVKVAMTTLDAMIDRYGTPDFCKVDVEGYESEVFAGLSQPLPAVSFEFTPEWAEGLTGSVERLAELGFDRFNVSTGETLLLQFPDWCSADEIIGRVTSLGENVQIFGDVYAVTRQRA
jgi:FkbM family methyltransferase